MGFSKIWVHGEANDGVVASITLELLAKARELADSVEVVMAGDAESVASELGDHLERHLRQVMSMILK